MKKSIPILLLWFNRPQHAQRLINKLREIQPQLLYIAIDGPRQNNLDDIVQVQQTIELLDTIDWPCTIYKLIRPQNLGCKIGVSSAINWFFEHVEAGIILEDDCIPDSTFFSFCHNLLEYYKHDECVMHIGGTNLVKGRWWGQGDYLFTKICHIWGWATWRRAWLHYDISMKSYPQKGYGLVDQVIDNKSSRSLWKQMFDEAYKGNVDTWDYQWVYSIWATDGLCVLPSANLITNIGFDAQATHTKFATKFSELPTGSIPVIGHPKQVAENNEATQWLFKTLYRPSSKLVIWLKQLKSKVSLLKKW